MLVRVSSLLQVTVLSQQPLMEVHTSYSPRSTHLSYKIETCIAVFRGCLVEEKTSPSRTCCAASNSALPEKTPVWEDRGRWHKDRHPMTIANMYEIERFDRGVVNGDFYVTSTRYKGQRTRDNTWIAFKQFGHAYAPASVGIIILLVN